MKYKVVKILVAFGLICFILGCIMDYFEFSSSGLIFGVRVFSVKENYINGFGLKIIGITSIILGIIVYFENPRKNQLKNDDFQKGKNLEKLIKKLKKDKNKSL